MSDRIGKTFTLQNGDKIEVTEEDERRVYFTVDDASGTHSLPAHSFDDSVKSSSTAEKSGTTRTGGSA